MPIDLTVISADRDAIIADLPITVTIGGTTYSARKSTLKRETKYEVFGADSGYDFTVHLNATGTTIAPDDEVTISAIVYRVLDIEAGPCGVGLALHLGRRYA